MATLDVDFDARANPRLLPAHDGPATVHCELQMVAAGLEAESQKRTRTSICLVFDCSGSMAGDRVEGAIRAAKAIVDSTYSGNTVSLVAFESRSHVLLSEVRATKHGKELMHKEIDKLRVLVMGSTNMADGIRRGILAVRDSDADAKVMIVLSDGMANNSDRAQEAATDAAGDGIQVFAVGIGDGYRVDHLQALVAASNGQVFEESDADRIVETFLGLLARIDRFVATNVSVVLKLAEGVTPGPALRTLPNAAAIGIPHADADGLARLHLGNVERDTTYGLEVELALSEYGAGERKVLDATLVYDVPSLGLKEVVHPAEVSVSYVARAAVPAPAPAGTFRSDNSPAGGAVENDAPPGGSSVDNDAPSRIAPMGWSVGAGPHSRQARRTFPGAPKRQKKEAPPVPVQEPIALYDVVLTDAGTQVILVARELREATGAIMGHVKHLVRRGGKVQGGLEREAAEQLSQRLAAAGASVEVRPQAS